MVERSKLKKGLKVSTPEGDGVIDEVLEGLNSIVIKLDAGHFCKYPPESLKETSKKETAK